MSRHAHTPPIVALLLPSLGGGGMERVVLNLARGMQEDGVSAELVVGWPEGPLLSTVPPEMAVTVLGHRRMAAALPALARYLRRREPYALVSSLDYANVVSLLARRVSRSRTRVVCTLHKPISVATADSTLLRERLLLKRAVRMTYPRADAIVAVSSGIADDLASTVNVPRNEISVIGNPVISDGLLALSWAPVSHPWFKTGAPPVILAVGRLTRQKDYPTMLRAFRRLHQDVDARLMILGEGEDRAELEKLALALGVAEHTAFPGFVQNPYAYMRRSAVFAMSSIYEGLPTVMIEALACGVSVVSTDCPHGPREILDGGRYGRLVSVGDDVALSRALLDALRSKATKLGELRAAEYSVAAATVAYRQLLGV